ncbi:MAG: hypothetical protein KME15_20085 [Drouetiella hepatica Uher 2000/2452]|jgi:hypothetical protein|uniref:Uncharacterized protein n=1 Tax=Drouetiella hepatica Uher 2000/2452 TaxID=904376 RepID=A0A951UNZ4_9CYAN|nr:hypothetical protein [Drouetiella hepatica Uher 2000/2452]
MVLAYIRARRNFGAAIAENRKAPNGADLIIANSSEAILNRGQQAALAAALSSRGSGCNKRHRFTAIVLLSICIR